MECSVFLEILKVLHADTPPFSRMHEDNTQMEYLSVYATGLHSTSFSTCCATLGAYRNGANVYNCTCGVVR